MTRIVLASSSPRRRDLLSSLGVDPVIIAPGVDETPLPGEAPAAMVARLAAAKSAAVVVDPDDLVIAADTTVDVDGEVFGTPVDAADARRMLHLLADRAHLVHTAVAVRRGAATRAATVTTTVRIGPLTAAEVDWYVATGEPLDKAGGYALQGRAAAFVDGVEGSVSGVVGLPLATLRRLAGELGVWLPVGPTAG